MKKYVLFVILILIFCLSSVSAENIDLTNNTLQFNSDINVNQSTVIDKEVTISSNGSSIVADNCNVFNITENGKLTLINLTISNGKTAIYNAGTLYLLNCNIINNNGVDGAGIYSTGKLTIINSTFSNNVVSHFGGAIYNTGDYMVVENSKFTSNIAKINNGEVEGGAIYNEGENLTINNCIFEENGCSNSDWYQNGEIYGGAISNRGNNLLVSDSIFYKNYIYGYLDTSIHHIDLNVKYGGGISSFGTGTIKNNTFDYNEIYAYFPSYSPDKMDCSARGFGSGVYVKATTKIINNTFINNRAGRAPLFITADNCLIDGNYFLNNSVRHTSPAIEINGKNSTIINNKILRNNYVMVYGTATSSIDIHGGENEVIMNNYFENCSGIYYYNVYHDSKGEYDYRPANAVIKSNIFKNCNEAIYIDTGVDITIEGNQFYDCHVGISAGNSRNINITHNLFSGISNYYKFDDAESLVNGHSHSSAPSAIHLYGQNGIISENIFVNITSAGSLITVYNGNTEGNSVIGNYFVNNDIINNGEGYPGNSIIEGSFLDNAEISDNYFADNNMNGGSMLHLESFYSDIINNVFNSNDGTVFMFEDYYKYNDFIFGNNKISDMNSLNTGQVLHVKDKYVTEHDVFDIPGTVIRDYGNSQYTGDGSEFTSKMNELLQFILNGLKRPINNSTTEQNPNNPTTDKPNTDNPTNNDGSNVKPEIDTNSNKTESETSNNQDLNNGNNLHETNSNQTSENSNAGLSNNVIKPIDGSDDGSKTVENGAIVSNDNSNSVGLENSEEASASAKSYELKKKSGQNSDDGSLYLKIFAVVIICLILLGIGYYKKK